MSTAFSSSPERERPRLAEVRAERLDGRLDRPLSVVVAAGGVEVEAGVGIAPDVERGHGEGRDEVAAVDDGVDALAFEQRDGRLDGGEVVVGVGDDTDAHGLGVAGETNKSRARSDSTEIPGNR